MAENKTNLIMYTTEDGVTKIQATFDNDTVWLSIDQMAELFQRDKSTISRHIKNIFEEGEYISDSVVANFATTAKDGKTYQVEYYNLDVQDGFLMNRHWIKPMRNTKNSRQKSAIKFLLWKNISQRASANWIKSEAESNGTDF